MLQILNTQDSRFSGTNVWDVCSSVVRYPPTIYIAQISKLFAIQMLSGVMSRYLESLQVGSPIRSISKALLVQMGQAYHLLSNTKLY